MSRVLYIIILATFLFISDSLAFRGHIHGSKHGRIKLRHKTTTTVPLKCGENEIVDNCPVDCPADNCPKSIYDNQSKCPKPKNCPPPACKCGFNSRRARNGSCISTRECPPFECNGPNEVFDPCPTPCPGENCSQATPDGQCHLPGFIRFTVECKPACRCKQNYWRLYGLCVPYDLCPKENDTLVTTPQTSTTESFKSTVNSTKSDMSENKWENQEIDPNLTCGYDEVLDDCPVDCPSDSCPKSRYVDQSKCPKPENCPRPACKCGYNSRRADNGSCISTKDCPSFECTGPNEEYNPCPMPCPGENCSQATSDGKCHLFGVSLFAMECVPACKCKQTFWRLNGVCVPYKQCPKECRTANKKADRSEVTTTQTTDLSCGINELVDDCPTDCPSDKCPKSRNDDQSYCPKPEKCPPPACKCEFNTRRSENGTCIPTRECPPFNCTGPNEEYNSCPAPCPGETCSQATPDGECDPPGHILFTLECVPACRCKKTFWRLNGVCVPYDECKASVSTTTDRQTVATIMQKRPCTHKKKLKTCKN